MSEHPKDGTVEIAPIGSYVDIDKDGYIINPTGVEKLQPHWKPLINEVLRYHQQLFGDDLHSFFIRGSVAKGQAVDGISDLDSFAFIRNRQEIKIVDSSELLARIREHYPFAEGVELQFMTVDRISKEASLIIQALQIFGEPVEQPLLRPGRDMIRNAKGIFNRMAKSDIRINRLQDNPNQERIQEECVWIMKHLLRSGVELTYERSGRFTRDLYLCYKDFAEYYPEYSEAMYRALYLALNPSTDLQEVIATRDALIPLLQQEAVRLNIAAPSNQ